VSCEADDEAAIISAAVSLSLCLAVDSNEDENGRCIDAGVR